MPKVNRPPVMKLVNRGAAGLLNKATEAVPRPAPVFGQNMVDRIRCRGVVVPLDQLVPDPMNARLHPEKNMESIKESLCLYGQCQALVVQKRSNKIVAGNGRWLAAKELGWTKLAVDYIDLDDLEVAGFGVADNRTAELAAWDFRRLKQLEAFKAEAGQPGLVGYGGEEVMALRQMYDEELAGGEVDDPFAEWDATMPEFFQGDLTSFAHIVVHFRSEEDLLDFLRIVGQQTGDVRQKSIWHPKAEIATFADKRWVTEEEKS